MQFKQFPVLVLLLNVLVGACASSSRTIPVQVPLTLVHSSLQNSGESKSMGAMWISNSDQWVDLIDRASEITENLPRSVGTPEIDFTRYGILLIRMGEKPTGGYGLMLMANVAKIENRTVLVPVRWVEPEKGAITAQMITSPYLMIQMEKGAFDRITVIDQDGREKLHTKVDSNI